VAPPAAPAPAEPPAPEPAPAPEPEAPFPPPGGGAWLAWGVQRPGPDEAPSPVQGLRQRSLGSARVELAEASERTVGLGQVSLLASLQAEPDWEQGLQSALQRPGGWLLHAWAPAQATLGWGCVLPAGPEPWAASVDAVAGESWSKRWARKTDEWGEAGVPAPCQMGRSADGGWWIAYKASLIQADPGAAAPLAVEPAWPTAAWREAFEDFCLKMEIPRQSPHWLLLALNPSVK